VVAGGEVLVEMRRFAEADTLAARAASGRADHESLHRLGELIAGFHARAAHVDGGGVRAALARVHRNLEDVAELDAGALAPRTAWSLARPLSAFALRHTDLFEGRAARGCWRDGHGDLRADHVVIDGHGIQIVDRLEFDPDLRADDVASDLAFLLMDLEARGASWAASEVLTAYRAAGGDAGDDRLLAFWMTYRASVSAKVAVLRAAQLDSQNAMCAAAARIALAGRLAWRTRTPRVLVVCGPPASGKSTLAAELHRRSGHPVLSSDVIRKRQHHLALTERAPAEAYSAAASLAVHEELGSRAAGVLAFRGGVIVDATMGSPALRAVFAEALGAVDGPVAFIECRVPEDLALSRARARQWKSGAVSDATVDVTRRLRAAWSPLDEVAPERHLPVRADRDAAAIADDVERRLDEVGA
jgi:predicted kinase